MTVWVVAPIKAPDACKTRLKDALSDPAREALVARMLWHVVACAETVVGPDSVLLLGSARHGLPEIKRLLHDPGTGLNDAIAAAARAAVAAGIDRVVFLSADLPLLTAHDIRALACEDDHVYIAPDAAGEGTNALSLPLPAGADFRFQFGPASFALHCAEAARRGLPLHVVRSATLGFDVDTPEDLTALMQIDQSWGTNTGLSGSH